jgi:pentatricopeptide repeat protein
LHGKEGALVTTILIKRPPPGWSILYYALVGVPLRAASFTPHNGNVISYFVSFSDIITALTKAGKHGEAALIKRELRKRKFPPDGLTLPANLCIEKDLPEEAKGTA